MAAHIISALCFLGYLSVARTEPCRDIDTSSCQLMAASKPDLCQDPSLSITACPDFCNICVTDQITTTQMSTMTMAMIPTTTTSMAVCEDVDTSACQLLQAQKPDLCSDPSLSVICTRFCNLCPLACYNCLSPVGSLGECKTKALCNVGEVCMRTEMKSSTDGHREYVMGCVNSQECDGTNLHLIFGRNIKSRDVSVSCCGADLCNNPAFPTTPIVRSTGVVSD